MKTLKEKKFEIAERIWELFGSELSASPEGKSYERSFFSGQVHITTDDGRRVGVSIQMFDYGDMIEWEKRKLKKALLLLEATGNKVGSSKLLTVKKVATRLSVSEKTVYRMVNHGDMPVIRIGSALRFDPDVVESIATGERSA